MAPLTDNPSDYVALRPRAARFLAYLTAKVYELSGEERPLAVTRATYDDEAATTLTPHDPGAAADAGVHARASRSTYAGGTDQARRRRHFNGRWNASRRSG